MCSRGSPWATEAVTVADYVKTRLPPHHHAADKNIRIKISTTIPFGEFSSRAAAPTHRAAPAWRRGCVGECGSLVGAVVSPGGDEEEIQE